MARHLIKVNNQNSLLNSLDSGYIENPYVALVSGATAPDYNGSSATPFEQQYFTIQAVNGMAFISIPSEVSYSTDRGATWLSNGSVFLLNGQAAWLKGTSVSFSTSNKFSLGVGNINVYGNIMSLQYGDNFSGQTSFSSGCVFRGLFYNCTGLIDAENLILPATDIPKNGYRDMFAGCTSLAKAPKVLPATTLGETACREMFKGCTSLSRPSTISATTVGKNTCYAMFSACTSLVETGDLPATTLGEGCYRYMFMGCTGLQSIMLELPATTLAPSCYMNMFHSCTSITRTPFLPASTLAEGCYMYMFYGCSSLTNILSLSATTVANGSCQNMFAFCSSLTTAPSILSATTLAQSCYSGMFNSCSSLTTAPELPATTLAIGCYNSMFYDCTNLNYIKCLATDISASNCTAYWLGNVASTGTFVKDPNMSSWTTGQDGIPEGWTVEDSE